MRRLDLVGGLIWIVFGIFLCVEAIKLKLGDFHNPGAGFFAFVIGGLLVLFGVMLIFTTVSGKLREDGEEKIIGKGNRKRFLLPSLTFFILFGYVVLLDSLGFLLTTFICLFLLFKISEPKKNLAPFLFSITTVFLSYLLFRIWLKCQLPKGIFGF